MFSCSKHPLLCQLAAGFRPVPGARMTLLQSEDMGNGGEGCSKGWMDSGFVNRYMCAYSLIDADDTFVSSKQISNSWIIAELTIQLFYVNGLTVTADAGGLLIVVDDGWFAISMDQCGKSSFDHEQFKFFFHVFFHIYCKRLTSLQTKRRLDVAWCALHSDKALPSTTMTSRQENGGNWFEQEVFLQPLKSPQMKLLDGNSYMKKSPGKNRPTLSRMHLCLG